jgi:hypothetical protein
MLPETLVRPAQIVLTQLLLLLAAAQFLPAAQRAADVGDPTQVVQAYLRATYARDYVDAYRYISTADQRVKDLNRYAQQRGAFMGFALEAAKKLASFAEIRTTRKQLSPDRMQAVAKIGIAEPALLFNLDARRLNSMSVDERHQLMDSWDKRKRDGSLQMLEVEEKLELVKEGEQWRVFLNWAAGVKIFLRLVLPNALKWEASVSNNEVTVQPGEFFDVSLKVKNLSSYPAVARIRHRIEPQNLTDFLDFVECGFLLPVTLQPGKEQEYESRYLLRGTFPEGVHRLNLTYDFRRLIR